MLAKKNEYYLIIVIDLLFVTDLFIIWFSNPDLNKWRAI